MITVVGIGEDGVQGLSMHGLDALTHAVTVYGGKRHLGFVPDNPTQTKVAWSKDLDADIAAMADAAAPVCVVASGDPLNHGIGTKIIAHFGAESVTVLPAPSAYSLAAARMGWSLDDPMVRGVSIHARPFAELARAVQPNVRLLILSRDAESPDEVAAYLSGAGYGQSPMVVLERIGGDAERREESTAAEGFTMDFDNINVIAVRCVADVGARALSTAPGLPDEAFDHDGNITKREVRAVTLAALAPKPGEMLWDVGAGHGTVAIEWLRAEPAANAIAIEQKPERVARIVSNAESLGVPSLAVVSGAFADVMNDINREPDAIFVGGGIVDLLYPCMARAASGCRIVANAVTVAAQSTLEAAYAEHGGELVRIGIAKAEAVGPHAAMKPALDVLQWRWVKP